MTNPSRDASRFARPAVTPGARLNVTMPAELADLSALQYVLQTLLRPIGMELTFQTGEGPGNCAKLSWPGSQAEAVDVPLGDLRRAFAAVSGQREASATKDQLGRVSAAALGLDCSQPIWSQYALDLAGKLAALNPQWSMPKRQLTVQLTHDVDRVHPLDPMSLLGRFVRSARGLCRGDAATARDTIKWLANALHFVDTYRRIMDLERQAGAVGTYFFMSGPYSFRRYGSRGGKSKRLARLTQIVSEYGHRVGLHGCIYSLDRDDYARQRDSLSRSAGLEVAWHRNHYLVWDAVKSPAALASGGLCVDTTCGFHDANAFRAGLAWPYELWNSQTNQPSGVMEIPLVFMDATGDLSCEETWAQLYSRLESALSVGGHVAVLFHVGYFVGYPQRVARYAELLTWLKERGAVLGAAEQLGPAAPRTSNE